MGYEKEATTIKEQAAERERGIMNSIESLRQETGGTNVPGTPISEVLNRPQHEVQTPPVIETFYNSQIVNEGGKKGGTDESSTWKETADKRKQDKGAKKG